MRRPHLPGALAAGVVAAGVFIGSAASAAAHDVARRCGYEVCAIISCWDRGNRCHRYDTDRYYGRYHGRDYRHDYYRSYYGPNYGGYADWDGYRWLGPHRRHGWPVYPETTYRRGWYDDGWR